MIQVPVNELIKKTHGSIYKLVILAGKRAVELQAGAPKLIDGTPGKFGTIALYEILEGKVRMKEETAS